MSANAERPADTPPLSAPPAAFGDSRIDEAIHAATIANATAGAIAIGPGAKAEGTVNVTIIQTLAAPSTVGTDLVSVENRRPWPVLRLVIEDFAGVQGKAAIDFAALTIVQGTSKLSHSVGEILRIFSRRDSFETVRQPASGNEAEMARWPIGERSIVVTLHMREARHFADKAKLQLAFSDGRTFEVSITDRGAGLSQGGVPLPSFSEVCKAIVIDEKATFTLQRDCFGDDQRSPEERLSSYFGVSNREMISCLEGTVLDDSVFGYGFRVTRDGRCEVKLGGGAAYRTLGALSSGEKARAMVEIGARLVTYSARVGPSLFLVDRLDTVMDGAGVRRFLEWVEREPRPFQTVVDLWHRPTCELHRALYYIAQGTDMNVSGFEITPLRDLEKPAR